MEKENKLISVIMCAYNEKLEFFEAAINSIINQTYENLQIIIVIDNPNKHSLIKCVERFAKCDNRIDLIYNSSNIGLTKSLNKAIKIVKGDYVARMDADDISELNRIEVQYNFLIENKLDLVGSETRRISEKGEIIMERSNIAYPSECIHKCLKYDNCVAHPSWFLKTEVYKNLNGYRDIHTCEDYDFLLRCLLKGYRIGIKNQILLNYRINSNGISRTNSLKQMLSANYLQKNINRIDDVNQNEIDIYLSKKLTKKKALNYEKSLVSFNDSISRIKKHEVSFIYFLLKSIIISPYVMKNIHKIIAMEKERKRVNYESTE